MAKSLLTAVFRPAWVWINRPNLRWLFASYSASASQPAVAGTPTLVTGYHQEEVLRR
ncbi:MAG: hypothetical protein ABSG65_20245 [Bryobacteraceae bacterium]|jgi:hypothetical protein